MKTMLIRVFAIEVTVDGSKTVHSFESRTARGYWLSAKPLERRFIDASARTVCKAKFEEEIVHHSAAQVAADNVRALDEAIKACDEPEEMPDLRVLQARAGA